MHLKVILNYQMKLDNIIIILIKYTTIQAILINNIYKQDYNITDDNYNELVDITLCILEEYMDIRDHTLQQIKNNIQQQEKQELYNHY